MTEKGVYSVGVILLTYLYFKTYLTMQQCTLSRHEKIMQQRKGWKLN